MLGEDSGIEVDGLGGEPGVHSARWHEGRGEVPALLERLEGIEGEGRRARYVCELVALAPDGRELRGRGELHGRIAAGPSGTRASATTRSSSPTARAAPSPTSATPGSGRDSHRARAARALAEALPTVSGTVTALTVPDPVDG